MRDIRKDLQDRLDAVASKQEKLQKQVADLEVQKKLLLTLLREEQRRWGDDNVGLESNGHKSRGLSEIIRDIMSDGEPWYGATIAAAAEKRGYHFGNSKQGRVTHFTLIGMARKGIVQSVGTGKWKLKESDR